LSLISRQRESLAVAALLLTPLFAHGQEASVYEIRPSPEGRFALEVFKTGLWKGRKHLFLFGDYRGSLRLDLASPWNSTVQFTVEGASAACQDTWVGPSDLRNIQSKAFEMMDVASYPRLVFSSRRIVPLGLNRYEVQGSLEIGGRARPVTVNVTLSKQEPDVLMFNGSAEVRLNDYGLKPPSAALGLIGTQNEMDLEFALRANKVQ
jgi:polyisoprenoid-binding protein YceI